LQKLHREVEKLSPFYSQLGKNDKRILTIMNVLGPAGNWKELFFITLKYGVVTAKVKTIFHSNNHK